jgi:hypothetical protein
MRGCRLPISSKAFWRTLALFFCLFTFCGRASADDSSPFTNLDAGVCDTLEDIHLQVGPPDAEIVAACHALRRSKVFSQSFSGSAAELALSLVGIALTYVVFGVPMRALAGLMGAPVGRSRAAMTIEALLGVALRGALGLLLLVILQLLPFAPIIGCLAIMGAMIALMLPRLASPPTAEIDNVEAAPSAFSVVVADLANDAAASALGVLGVALLAREDVRVLALGIVFVVVASSPIAMAARRRLRGQEINFLAIAAVLSAIYGVVAAADPQLAEGFGQMMRPTLSIPLLFAGGVIGVSWMARRESPA